MKKYDKAAICKAAGTITGLDKAAICKAVGTITGLIIVFINLKGVDLNTIYALTNISTFALLGYLAGNILYVFINIVNEVN